MAGKITKEITASITGVSGGTLTVASSAGFYARQYGYLQKAGQPGVFIQIASIPDSTHIVVRQVKDRGDGVGFGDKWTQVAVAPNYGTMDASLYNAGVISCPEQVTYNPNDLGLT